MVTGLVVVALLGAEPLSVFLDTVKTSDKHAAEAPVWTEVIAGDLRAWGMRVTTQDDLAALLTGKKQQQRFGCDDKDCGLDPEILTKGDLRVVASAVGDE